VAPDLISTVTGPDVSEVRDPPLIWTLGGELPALIDGQIEAERRSSAVSQALATVPGMDLSRELGFNQTKVRKARLEFRPRSPPANSATLPLRELGACCGKQMALNVEGIVDRGVRRQEALR
jgi:hypothetical protein